MKSNRALRVAALWCAVVAMASAQSERPAPPSAAAVDSAAASTLPPLTFAEAQLILAKARKYVAHPDAAQIPGKVVGPEALPQAFPMDTPPPAPLTESKSPAPKSELVWVEGHYMPVEKQWRWVMGVWAVPATSISVWIPGRYDQKVKTWYPGYWEPEAPPTPPGDSTPTP